MNDVFIVNFDPVAFSFGVLRVRWYGLSYVVGFVMTWGVGNFLLRLSHSKITSKEFSDFMFYAMMAAVIGGRLGYALFYNINESLSHPLSVFKIWQGGMSFHGGFIGVCITALFFSYKKNIPLLALSDLCAVISPIGLFWGRIANFINGELWGRPSTASWAVIFPAAGTEPRHPSPLYEALGEGILLFFILMIMYHVPALRLRRGWVTASFLLCYACARFFVEFFREPDAHIGLLAFHLSLGQWLTLPMIFFGFTFMIYSLSSHRK